MIVLLAVRFISELALLVAVAFAGAELASGPVASGVAAVVAVAVTAGVWGGLVAPKAHHRLPDPWRLGVELALFAVATVGLAGTGHGGAAVAFAVVSASAAITMRLAPSAEDAIAG